VSRERPAATAALQAEELTREVDALRLAVIERDRRIESLTEEVALLRGVTDAPKPVGDVVWVLKARMMLNDVEYKPGDELPFDPHNPPAGCNGLVEGRHYDRARVIVRRVA
jgi:hypothetical protein